MRYYEVAPTSIVRPGSHTFTYHSKTDYSVGQIVAIPVGKKELLGIVIKQVKKPLYQTKEITKLVVDTPLPPQLIKTALWMHVYYSTPLALVLQSMLPRGLTKNRRKTQSFNHTPVRKRTNIVFNKDQQAAINNINSHVYGSIILHGITGSGKTEIYKEVVRQAVNSGKSAIVLVPEISLTSQIIDEFSQSFPNIIVTHSKLTEAQRHLAWQRALVADLPVVALGPRSALMLPLNNVGAIIVDEAHEPSYKQSQAPRYSALRVASILGSAHEAKVIFGSATPSVVDYYIAQTSHKPIVRLESLAKTDAKPAKVSVIDMTQKESRSAHPYFSPQLIASLTKTLKSGHQSLIFHNRRGSANTTLCQECGWTALCPNCFIPLILHGDTFELRCHTCSHNERMKTECPNCKSPNIIHKGVGTKRIEEELKRLFPKARIARFDSDNTANESAHNLYSQLYDGEFDIIIGTQVIAKGLDLPHLRMVGIVQADSGLMLPDFAAGERTFQLISQVVGRVGRSQHASEVIIQSYRPSHPIIKAAVTQDYDTFYNATIKERELAKFPPYAHLLLLINSYKSESSAIAAAKKMALELRQQVPGGVAVIGPTPAFRDRSSRGFHWQIIIKSNRREHLANIVSSLPKPHWQAELDPSSLL